MVPIAAIRCRLVILYLNVGRNCTVCRRNVTSQVVRQTFLDFFVNNHNHRYVKSSSVLPQSADASVLFTTAGMHQFKPIFLETVDPGHHFAQIKRAVNSQKCIRVGGKHNDLSAVGTDGYHHTFFEMLGNWSFGNYFKKEACEMAWELLTGIYKLPPKRLYVTYYGGDARIPHLQPDLECRGIWVKIGVDPKRIIPCGADDNFWDMGDSGPCGPCTEIHYDHIGNREVAHRVNAGFPDVTEIWNLVFMQFNRISDGSLEKLSRQHVDTGMGLERMTAILQGKISNYDTDLFQPLFNAVQKGTGARCYLGKFGEEDVDGVDTAYRIVADHSRMAFVSLCDGLLPDEYDAGQCLRKVMRRAILMANIKLQARFGLMATLFREVEISLQSTFPELQVNAHKATDVMNSEEERFLKLLDKGKKYFEDAILRSKGSLIFRGEWMWELYFVHGIPEEYIVHLAKCKGVELDFNNFYKMMNEEKAKSERNFNVPEAKKFNFDENSVKHLIDEGITPTNTENVHQKCVSNLTAKVVAIWHNGGFRSKLQEGNDGVLITDKTNFYAEGGGQLSDLGFIIQGESKFGVTDVQNVSGYVAHHGKLTCGNIELGATKLVVDKEHRVGCARNHTATHLLNAALHQVLKAVQQRSSTVGPSYLKFDYGSNIPLSRDNVQQVEDIINLSIRRNDRVERVVMPFEEAIQKPGIITLPGEVYPHIVNVIQIQGPKNIFYSLEPCCGTHVDSTAEIEDFTIIIHKSVSHAVRSIKALTGIDARNARKVAKQFKEEIDEMAVKLSDVSKNSFNQDAINFLQVADKDLRHRKKIVESGIYPILDRYSLEKEVESAHRSVTQLLKQHAKVQFRRKIREDLAALVTSTKNDKFLVHLISTEGDHKEIFSEATNLFSEKPCMFFVKTGDVLHCQSYVPQSLTTEEFNAKIWGTTVFSSVKTVGEKAVGEPCVKYSFRTRDAYKIQDFLNVSADVAVKYVCKK